MSEYLPKELRAELRAAQKANLKKRGRLRVQVGSDSYPVLRFWDGGFALDADTAPHLRGLVDLYNGGAHLYQCLIVASSEQDGQIDFEFKRNTVAADRAPLDFFRDPDAPIALLGR